MMKKTPKECMINLFRKVYKTNETPLVFFAPGRVNLIGEHTDYNGGHVFPCAITLGTFLAIAPRADRKVRLFSQNFEKVGICERTIDDMFPVPKSFTNYPIGVIKILKDEGYRIGQGFDMVLYGTLPNSSGLSSSASIEVLTMYAISCLMDYNISLIDIAKLCQKSENEFNKVNCGIMDQFSIAMGRKNNAIFLDTNTLEYKYVPLNLAGTKLIITSTNKRRGLADSKYNERRAECEQALKDIKKAKNIKTLGDLTIEEFEECKQLIKDPTNVKRAKHAVYENARTIQAVEALSKGDILAFGDLMLESHISLRDDYEVTGRELDTLFEEAKICPGVIGTRMTGAGFGGCNVSLVKEAYVDEFMDNVSHSYKRNIGYSPSFYTVLPADGPRML